MPSKFARLDVKVTYRIDGIDGARDYILYLIAQGYDFQVTHKRIGGLIDGWIEVKAPDTADVPRRGLIA